MIVKKGGNFMKILVLTGSPHKNGTSSHLADQFIKGAEEKGHEVIRYDAASLNLKGCLGCKYCRKHDDMCVHHDIMDKINKELIESDMVVFVTPLFFMGMSAQLKTLIDRFYAVLKKLPQKNASGEAKKYMLFSTCADKGESPISALLQYFKVFGENYGWQNCGHIIAQGYNSREDIEGTIYASQAYEAGLNL